MGWQRAATIAGICALVLLVGLLSWTLTDGDETRRDVAPRVVVEGVANVGGPFTLMRSDGTSLSDTTLRGRPFVLMFGYTRSSEQTPAMVQALAAALERADGRSNIEALFVTLDPEHDTGLVLASYLSRFSTRIGGLTGSRQQIERLAARYHAQRREHPSTPLDPSPSIEYAGLFYIMDRKGALFRAVEAPVLISELADALRDVLQTGNH
jgi:protein SCO1/2